MIAFREKSNRRRRPRMFRPGSPKFLPTRNGTQPTRNGSRTKRHYGATLKLIGKQFRKVSNESA